MLEIEDLLAWAETENPGPWVRHSKLVGEAARSIAERTAGLDPDTAQAMGMLHDIGRRYRGTNIRHCIDGYGIMIARGYPDIAGICITHSFQIKSLKSYEGKYDITQEEGIFVEDYLAKCVYDEYDLLIQLCDAVADGGGYCLIEKRLVDVALRNGIAELMIEKWKRIFELKSHFEGLIGCSIYSFLPGAIENSVK
jgi:hypothetical protein